MRLCHRIHGRAHDRNIQLDMAREAGPRIGLGRRDLAVRRLQQHVVKRKAFCDCLWNHLTHGNKLRLPGHLEATELAGAPSHLLDIVKSWLKSAHIAFSARLAPVRSAPCTRRPTQAAKPYHCAPSMWARSRTPPRAAASPATYAWRPPCSPASATPTRSACSRWLTRAPTCTSSANLSICLRSLMRRYGRRFETA